MELVFFFVLKRNARSVFVFHAFQISSCIVPKRNASAERITIVPSQNVTCPRPSEQTRANPSTERSGRKMTTGSHFCPTVLTYMSFPANNQEYYRRGNTCRYREHRQAHDQTREYHRDNISITRMPFGSPIASTIDDA